MVSPRVAVRRDATLARSRPASQIPPESGAKHIFNRQQVFFWGGGLLLMPEKICLYKPQDGGWSAAAGLNATWGVMQHQQVVLEEEKRGPTSTTGTRFCHSG